MKRSLFQSGGQFYKANLHNHTVVSDGRNTPEEIKALYQAQGYQIVAFTDHNILIDHCDLNDDMFLALTGMEYDYSEELRGRPYSFMKTYHVLLIAKNHATEYYPCANPAYTFHNEKNLIQPYYKGNYIRKYSAEAINELFADAHAHGFITYYCHPAWSIQSYPDYCGLEGADFIEAYNTGAYVTGFDLDKSDHVYHDFLALGKRALPAASDDGHCDFTYFGGATYIKADDLSYESIFKSIERQDVYASWGPEIKEIWYDRENGKIGIETSGAKEIFLLSERRYCEYAVNDHGARIYNGTFDIARYLSDTVTYGDPAQSFLRFIVTDFGGNKALSRGYFVDELLKK